VSNLRGALARVFALALMAGAMALPVAAQDATASAPAPAAPLKKDPFEGFNRSVFSFNEAVDAAVLKPVAQTYRDLVPEFVRTTVDNVFGNVADVWSTANQLLQGKLENTLRMGFRVATNTVLGFGGMLDIATEAGLERQSEDFGQTLGRWGLPPGPYLVLPVLGPSTARDTAALVADLQVGATQYIENGTTGTLVGVTLLQVVSTRAGLLGASKVLDDVALDKYSFLRDAYLARRKNQVYDGDPPPEPEDEDPESRR
jgi:phospholipid-binding lipoprotein MlaA